jgi:uncharacterized protein YjbI with pentapeptide repeats
MIEKEVISKEDFIRMMINHHNSEISDKIIEDCFFDFSRSPINYGKRIVRCEFKNGGEFIHLECGSEIVFDDCYFKANEDHSFKFSKMNRGTLSFRTNNVFDAKVIFQDLRNQKTEISGCFSNDLVITGGETQLSIRGSGPKLSKFQNIIFTSVSQIKSILLRDLEHANKITFHGSVPKRLYIAQGVFGRIQFQNVFDIPYLKIGSLNTEKIDVKIDNLDLQMLNLSGKMEVLYSEINDLNMNHCRLSGGSLAFKSVVFKNEIQLCDSNLKDVQFMDVNLKSAKLFLDRSIISNAIYSNVLWPKDFIISSKIKSNNTFEKTRRLRTLTEAYRQLKKNALSESDNFSALHFYRNEMINYWERVKVDKTESRWNRLLIRVNKWVSDFGQSYLLPLAFLFVFTLIGFIGIWSFEYFTHGNSGKWCSTIGNGFVEFLTGLNPISKVPDYWHNGAKIIVFFLKVFNGFFIYHFIKATRKFGRI